MGSAIVYQSVRTNSSFGQVKQATRAALAQLGGMIMDTPDGFQIRQGKIGTSFGFTADLTANVSVRQGAGGAYDITCSLSWSPAAIVWVCLVIGFFIFGILWLVGLFYLFFSPTNAYQQALFHIDALVPGGVVHAPMVAAVGGAPAATVYAPAGVVAAVAAPTAAVCINGRAVTSLPRTPGVRYTVGRDPSSSVVVDDPMVSGTHAVLQVHSSGDIGVYDAGSTNGTFVNGAVVSGEHRLRPGDEITLGSSNCRMTLEGC